MSAILRINSVPSALPPTFFATPADLRRWFAENHATARELHVGFYKKGSGHPSITWPESVDEALCVGWIDGVRRRADDRSYTIRFTPRKTSSIWSAVNVARVGVLAAANRMQPSGLAAFAARQENRSGVYSYEQRRDHFDEPYETLFKQHPEAWEFFQKQPPSYRKKEAWRVVSAKQEATRLQRLDKLIAESAAGRRLP